MNGVSLFCSAGIAETYFKRNGIDIVVASELLQKRCDIHSWLYKKCHTICGDITQQEVFDQVKKETAEKKCKFLLATPPCQGMSTLGKKEYETDKRNYLVFYVLDLIDCSDFDYILIENVPKFLQLYFPYKKGLFKLIDIVKDKYAKKYNIDSFVLNAKDYGVPQSRPRGFIRIWKKGLNWKSPEKKKEITVREAIGNLPTLEAGQDSGIKWHYAKKHNERDIDAMKHTPEGKSALQNPVHFPKKANGERMKGFHNTFKRIKWDEPCPARAMQSGNMGGHNNCHPGRPLPDGTYSDARVLTLRELFIVSSLPADWNLPTEGYTDNFYRQIVGEAIPPRFSEAIIKGIGKK
jgi:DNA (cytosine-5)-methyltransferase 1